MIYEQYCKLLKSIENSYGDTYEKIMTVTDDAWNGIVSSVDNTYDFLKNLGVETQYNTKGEVVGYTRSIDGYTGASGSDAGDYSNSNNLPSTTSNTRKINLPYEMKYEHDGNGNVNILGRLLPVAETGRILVENGTLDLTGRLLRNKMFGTSVTTSLGQFVSNALYQKNPDIFGGIDPNKIDYEDYYPISVPLPEVGGSLNVGKFFNLIMGTNPDTGKSQMYLRDEDYAAIALQLYNLGFFTSQGDVATLTDTSPLISGEPVSQPVMFVKASAGQILLTATSDGRFSYEAIKSIVVDSASANTYIILQRQLLSWGDYQYAFIVLSNDQNFSITITKTFWDGHTYTSTLRKTGYITHNNIYACYNQITFTNQTEYNRIATPHVPLYGKYHINESVAWNLLYIITHGIVDTQYLQGITKQPDSKLPDFSSIDQTSPTVIQNTINHINNQYPDMYNNRLTVPVNQPDGTVKETVYYPVPIPQLPDISADTTGNLGPVSGDSRQTNAIVSPGLPEVPSIPVIVNPDLPDIDVGKGIVPPIILPTGSADALFTAYNPTLQQVQQFGAWLWSGNPIEQVKKLFFNPIDAIISLHKVYISPVANNEGTIHLGYLDSNVPSKILTNQTNMFNFGTISFPEYFGNVFDYDPFTEVSIYLPFVGIVPLNVKDIMRSSLQVIYQCDMYTGNIMAQINVLRDGNKGGTLYTYPGNCAERFPVSAGDISGTVSSAMNIAMGIGQTLAGNTMFGASQIARGVFSPKGSTQRGGDFSGNAGALGNRSAYLIVSRPQTMLADKFPAYQGKPTNFTTTVGACKGFIKCTVDHLENIPATADELTEIDTLLQQGILA